MNNRIIFLLVFFLLGTAICYGQEEDSTKIVQLEKRIKQLEEKFAQDEL